MTLIKTLRNKAYISHCAIAVGGHITSHKAAVPFHMFVCASMTEPLLQFSQARPSRDLPLTIVINEKHRSIYICLDIELETLVQRTDLLKWPMMLLLLNYSSFTYFLYLVTFKLIADSTHSDPCMFLLSSLFDLLLVLSRS